MARLLGCNGGGVQYWGFPRALRFKLKSKAVEAGPPGVRNNPKLQSKHRDEETTKHMVLGGSHDVQIQEIQKH